MGTSGDGQDNWEKNLRKREVVAAERGALAAERAVNTQKHTVRIQIGALVIATIATLAAAWAAYQAGNAVKTAQHIASQQAIENQIGTAVTAIGEKSPANQVAGLTLLGSSVQSELNAAVKDPNLRDNAYNAYLTSLEMIHVYLRSNTIPGRYPPIAAVYAADELRDILALGPKVALIHHGPPPSIDLSLIGLSGISWTGTKLGWLASAYMPWVDFRGADLAHTHWGHATLTHAHFQCADLEGADLHLANLQKADLRGANLTGAKLPRNAKLKWGVQAAGAVGPVNHLHIVKPAAKYAPIKCRTTKAYATVPAPFLLPARPGFPVPASAIQRLTAVASQVVKENGGVAPAWVSVVTTTYEKALISAIPGDIVPGAASTTVYLVTMKGHFTSTMHSSKAVPASGKYLSIVVNAETFGVTNLGLSRIPPRVAPACCGPVTYLQGVGTAARE